VVVREILAQFLTTRCHRPHHPSAGGSPIVMVCSMPGSPRCRACRRKIAVAAERRTPPGSSRRRSEQVRRRGGYIPCLVFKLSTGCPIGGGDTPPPMPFPPIRSRHTIPAVTWQPLP
jgi:hypothetical protein